MFKIASSRPCAIFMKSVDSADHMAEEHCSIGSRPNQLMHPLERDWCGKYCTGCYGRKRIAPATTKELVTGHVAGIHSFRQDSERVGRQREPRFITTS